MHTVHMRLCRHSLMVNISMDTLDVVRGIINSTTTQTGIVKSACASWSRLTQCGKRQHEDVVRIVAKTAKNFVGLTSPSMQLKRAALCVVCEQRRWSNGATEEKLCRSPIQFVSGSCCNAVGWRGERDICCRANFAVFIKRIVMR